MTATSKTSPERPLREEMVMKACLESYGRVRHDGWLADRALEITLRRAQKLFAAERRAVAERVYGLLRTQRRVDHLLAHGIRGFAAFPPARQDALRFAVLLRAEGSTRALSTLLGSEDRRLVDALPSFEQTLTGVAPDERFALEASLPPFLAERFRTTFGERAAPLMQAMNRRAPLTVRTNTLKLDRDALASRLQKEEVTTRPTPLSPLGLQLDTRQNAFSLESFREGGFEIQDEGSQLLGMLVDAPPTRVIDACAGAGGKTLQLAAQMKNRGELFAFDVDEGRLDELKRRARRAGVHNVRVRVIPPQGEEARAAVADLEGKADRVLVDAPCSGTGTFRRKPDARYRLSPEDLAVHVARQAELLHRFSVLVKPGGRLVYGTCSVLREENEEQIARFLEQHPEFRLRPVSEELGTLPGASVESEGFLRLFPDAHNTDGFFGAILVREK